MGIHWYTPPSHFEAMGHNQVYCVAWEWALVQDNTLFVSHTSTVILN